MKKSIKAVYGQCIRTYPSHMSAECTFLADRKCDPTGTHACPHPDINHFLDAMVVACRLKILPAVPTGTIRRYLLDLGHQVLSHNSSISSYFIGIEQEHLMLNLL